jgi:hypothetical protein
VVDGSEVPWFTEPPLATLTWGKDGLGHLRFVDPKGDKAVVLVTKDRPFSDENKHVWHIHIAGSRATVSPSIHFIGRWHTPNPAIFLLAQQ